VISRSEISREHRQTRAFRHQFELFGTLWSDGQVEDLEFDILKELEIQFGPMDVGAPPAPVQHAVGWLTESEHNRGERPAEPLPGWVRGARVCNSAEQAVEQILDLNYAMTGIR